MEIETFEIVMIVIFAIVLISIFIVVIGTSLDRAKIQDFCSNSTIKECYTYCKNQSISLTYCLDLAGKLNLEEEIMGDAA